MTDEERSAWHGAGAGIRFEPADFEVVDLALGQIPELRICALALKRARASRIEFPIAGVKTLHGLLEKRRFAGGGHEFGTKDIATFLPDDYFPIENEAALVSRIYLGLLRCRHEENARLHASAEVLKKQRIAPGGRAAS